SGGPLMTDELTPHDLTEQRLARDLKAAAGGMSLAPGAGVAGGPNGRRPRQRRRQANAIMLGAAAGIGTAFTIRQLARTGDSSVATDTLPTTDSTGSAPQAAGPPPTTPVETTPAPATTQALFPSATNPIEAPGDVPPA